MSALVWEGNNLLQRVGGKVEEIGHIKLDPISGKAVLWLRDTQNVFGVNGGHVRGDEFATMSDARRDAAKCVSAKLLHLMWLVGLRRSGDVGQEIAQATLDTQEGRPLTESTFKEEMERRDRAERKWKVLTIIFGALSLGVGVLALI